MVFSHPKYLGAIWIGNIFFHSSLKGSVGETVKTACDFAKSMVITTLISYPVAYFLERTTDHIAQLCLPIFTVVLSLWIMICPWLSSPNLMILVMYVMIAAPPRYESAWWEPFGYLGSYLIGLGMAVFMQLVCIPPSFRPNTAGAQVHFLMERLSKDFFLLFVHLRYYTHSTGNTPKAGNSITIEHDEGVKSFYAHCNSISVKAGDKVNFSQIGQRSTIHNLLCFLNIERIILVAS